MKALTADTIFGIQHTPHMTHDGIISEELFLSLLDTLPEGERIKAIVTDDTYKALSEKYGIN